MNGRALLPSFPVDKTLFWPSWLSLSLKREKESRSFLGLALCLFPRADFQPIKSGACSRGVVCRSRFAGRVFFTCRRTRTPTRTFLLNDRPALSLSLSLVAGNSGFLVRMTDGARWNVVAFVVGFASFRNSRRVFSTQRFAHANPGERIEGRSAFEGAQYLVVHGEFSKLIRPRQRGDSFRIELCGSIAVVIVIYPTRKKQPRDMQCMERNGRKLYSTSISGSKFW